MPVPISGLSGLQPPFPRVNFIRESHSSVPEIRTWTNHFRDHHSLHYTSFAGLPHYLTLNGLNPALQRLIVLQTLCLEKEQRTVRTDRSWKRTFLGQEKVQSQRGVNAGAGSERLNKAAEGRGRPSRVKQFCACCGNRSLLERPGVCLFLQWARGNGEIKPFRNHGHH